MRCVNTSLSEGSWSWSWENDWVWGQGSLLATISPKEGLQQVVVDHQGSAPLLANRCGRRIAELATNPWGLDVFDATQNLERHRYTGHLRDVNAPGRAWDDFDQMHARTYFPYTARFLSPDPGRDYDLSHPQSFNLYAYVRNNPVTLVEPWGLESASSPTAPRRNCDPDGRGNVECQGQQGFPREQAQASAFLDEEGAYHESVTVLAKPLPTGMERLTAGWPWLFDPNLAAAQRPPEMRAEKSQEVTPPAKGVAEYVSLTVAVAIPNPLTLTLVGAQVGMALDRFGNVYLQVGGQVGKAPGVVGGSLMLGDYRGNPTAEELSTSMAGWFPGFAAGSIIGMGINASGATEVGLTTPQASVAVGYTFRLLRISNSALW
jgi:RHS repeat-associated protein